MRALFLFCFVLICFSAMALTPYVMPGNTDLNAGKYGQGQGSTPLSYDQKPAIQQINSLNWVYPSNNNLDFVSDGNITIGIDKKNSKIILGITPFAFSTADVNNADYFGGQLPAYYLDYFNLLNTPNLGLYSLISDSNNAARLSYGVIANPPWLTSAADTNWQTSFPVFDANMALRYVKQLDGNVWYAKTSDINGTYQLKADMNNQYFSQTDANNVFAKIIDTNGADALRAKISDVNIGSCERLMAFAQTKIPTQECYYIISSDTANVGAPGSIQVINIEYNIPAYFTSETATIISATSLIYVQTITTPPSAIAGNFNFAGDTTNFGTGDAISVGWNYRKTSTAITTPLADYLVTVKWNLSNSNIDLNSTIRPKLILLIQIKDANFVNVGITGKYFGDGSALAGVYSQSDANNVFVKKTGDAMTGDLNVSAIVTGGVGTNYPASIGTVSDYSNISWQHPSSTAKARLNQRSAGQAVWSVNINDLDAIDSVSKYPFKIEMDSSTGWVNFQTSDKNVGWTYYNPIRLSALGNAYLNYPTEGRTGRTIVGSITDDAANQLQVTGNTKLTGNLWVTGTINIPDLNANFVPFLKATNDLNLNNRDLNARVIQGDKFRSTRARVAPLGADAAAFGFDTNATGAQGFAAGYQSGATNTATVALGYQAQANGLNGVAIGYQASANNTYDVGIGYGAKGSGFGSVAIGLNAAATGTYSVAIGASTAVGNQSFASAGGYASGDHSIALAGALSYGAYATAIGNSTANGAYSFVAGKATTATPSLYGSALGYNTNTKGAGSIAMGYNATTALTRFTADGNGSIVMGFSDDNSTADGNGAIVIGTNSKALANAAIAIGNQARALDKNSVAIGQNAVSAKPNLVTLALDVNVAGFLTVGNGKDMNAGMATGDINASGKIIGNGIKSTMDYDINGTKGLTATLRYLFDVDLVGLTKTYHCADYNSGLLTKDVAC